jgi:SHS2 domain-containing protein
MTVKEFFDNLNCIVADYNVYMRDISSNTEHRNSVNTLMENEDLYNDWKNAMILSWYVIENEFVLTVQKGEIL